MTLPGLWKCAQAVWKFVSRVKRRSETVRGRYFRQAVVFSSAKWCGKEHPVACQNTITIRWLWGFEAMLDLMSIHRQLGPREPLATYGMKGIWEVGSRAQVKKALTDLVVKQRPSINHILG